MARIPKAIRESVRKRANAICEYCQIPDNVTHFSHQVDHIIPPLHGGSDEMQNLAWACFYCNNRKSTNIATYDLVSREPVFLYNPYRDIWAEHFELDAGYVVGLTARGRGTVRLLRMNDYKRVAIRKILTEGDNSE